MPEYDVEVTITFRRRAQAQNTLKAMERLHADVERVLHTTQTMEGERGMTADTHRVVAVTARDNT